MSPHKQTLASCLLVSLRKQYGFSQAALAKKSNVSLPLIRRIEHASYRYVLRKKTIDGFSKAFHLDFGVLYHAL